MKSKRLIALFITLLMLLSLFSACSGTPTDENKGSDSGDDANVPDSGASDGDNSGEGDAPEEKEPTELSFLSYEAHGSYTLDSCTDYTTYKDMTQHLLDNYNLTMDRTIVNDQVYENTH